MMSLQRTGAEVQTLRVVAGSIARALRHVMVRSMLVFLGTIPALTLSSGEAGAQVVRQDFYVTNGTVNAAVVSGNTLYIGGEFTQVGPATGGGVAIDEASGAPLVVSPSVTGIVLAVVPDGSGGWYIGGDFRAVGGVSRQNLAHVLSNNTVSVWN